MSVCVTLFFLFFSRQNSEVESLPIAAHSEQSSPSPVVMGDQTTGLNTDQYEEAVLLRVVDGDTLEASVSGNTKKIRLIGVNTPEVVDPRKPVECYGLEASNFVKTYFSQREKTLLLEKDDSQQSEDRYGRLLRYVYSKSDLQDIGKLLISEGYAYEYTYSTPYARQSEYRQAQSGAELGQKGLWGDSECGK